MLKADIMEKCENEIFELRDIKMKRFCNLSSLTDSRKNLIQGNFNISFAWIIYRMIQAINIDINMYYRNNQNKLFTRFFIFHQWQWDDIFEICIKANRIGLEAFPKINPNNDLSYLDEQEVVNLLEIYEEAINEYFNLLLIWNVKYLNDEQTFINKMVKFGDNHVLTENDLVLFANKAMDMGINVANIDSLDELEELYNKLFPEA